MDQGQGPWFSITEGLDGSRVGQSREKASAGWCGGVGTPSSTGPGTSRPVLHLVDVGGARKGGRREKAESLGQPRPPSTR